MEKTKIDWTVPDLPGTSNLEFDNNIHKKGSLGHHSADSNPFPTLLCTEKSTKRKYLRSGPFTKECHILIL